jgi:hypothetical protein
MTGLLETRDWQYMLIFKDAVIFKDNIASVRDEWMSMEHGGHIMQGELN